MLKKPMLLSFLVLLSAATAAANLGTDPDLVIYFSFDEFDDIVMDLSGNGYHGTVKGNVTADPDGVYDGSARFVGSGYLDLDGPNVLPEHIPTSAITLAAWAKCENTGGHHAIFNARAGDATWLIHPEVRSGGNFRWLLRSAGGATIFDMSAGVVTWDEWLHYTGTYDKATGQAILYINGLVVRSMNVATGAEIAGDWNLGARVGLNIDNARPFTGLMDDFCLFTRALTEQEIQTLMQGISLAPAELAGDPRPADEADDVARDTALSWTAGKFAATHDVYIGTTFVDVNDAGRIDPRGVLVSQGQAATTFDPGLLEYGTTYYWRVDEVNAAPDFTIFKGEVWSFETEPYAYPLEGVTATASSFDAGSPPERTVDESGLDPLGGHSNEGKDMWLSSQHEQLPVWIQFELPGIRRLHQMKVWNFNASFEPIVGYGAKGVVIEYSLDGEQWLTLKEVEIPQAPAGDTYAGEEPIDLDGIEAKFVRLVIESNWSPMGIQRAGLSEVQFLYAPMQAREPQPADGTTGVALDTNLIWRSGREVELHEVYFGTDADAVAADTVPAGSQTVRTYTPPALDFGTTYFWRVDQVSELGVYAGELWSFTTQEYQVIDDFESYDDYDNAIFTTWLDGHGDDKNGSQVGHDNPPYAERSIVHSGRQSMPLYYENTNTATVSEAVRTFSPEEDWTVHGADTLRLFVHGVEQPGGNDPAPVYVALKDATGRVGVVTHPDLVARGTWTEWPIPLSDFIAAGVNLRRVTSMTIGVGDKANPVPAGGLVFIDDIAFGKPAAGQ